MNDWLNWTCQFFFCIIVQSWGRSRQRPTFVSVLICRVNRTNESTMSTSLFVSRTLVTVNRPRLLRFVKVAGIVAQPIQRTNSFRVSLKKIHLKSDGIETVDRIRSDQQSTRNWTSSNWIYIGFLFKLDVYCL